MDFSNLVSAYVLGRHIDYEINNDLLRVAKEQALLTILFPITSNNLYKKYYISGTVLDERFNNLKNTITKIFNDNCIKHLYVKGALISKLYPDSAIRTRGDIDVYVSLSDFNKAKKVLVDNGFDLEPTEDCAHHICFKKDSIEVELHFNLFDPGDGKRLCEIFNNPFDYSENVSNMEYKLQDTYHLVFAIAHFARHLRVGAGIRYMMDFYYMMNNTVIDKELLHILLKELNLEVLYNNILNALDVLFDYQFEDFKKKDIKFFIDYMLKYGIHGHDNNDLNYTSARKNKFNIFIARVFLTNRAYRVSCYPKIGKHLIFWPICFIRHTFYLVFNKLPKFFILVFKRNNRGKLYKDLGV